MQQFQKTKVTVLDNYRQYNTNAVVESTNALDTIDAGEAVIDIVFNSVATTSPTVIKLRMCATSGGTYEDVPNGAFTVFPVATTDDGKVWRIHVPIAQKGLLRFLKPAINKGDTNVARVTSLGYLIAISEAPVGATANGTAQTIVV
jgi:hypothetical protein